MNVCTEIQDYICRFTSMNPERDIAVIDCEKRMEIYSIGEDGGLYLTYENDGGAARYERVLLREAVSQFAVARIAATGKRAIAIADKDGVYLTITGEPWSCKKESFQKLHMEGVLGGKQITAADLQIVALEQGITLFIEMRDEGGRIEQFACVLDSERPESVRYYPLACNFSSVLCSAGGRAVNQFVDGIYSFGEYGGEKQLLYTPSCNIFGDSQPAPLRLYTEKDIEAICTHPLSHGEGTHLFAAGNSHLYLYPYERQEDIYHTEKPEPDLLATSPLFYGVRKIAAALMGDILYIYVLNESNVLSYTYGKYEDDRLTQVVEPVVLMEDVFYFDMGNAGTMNICGRDKAVFGEQDKATGQWHFTEVHIETELDICQKIKAYVTKISVGKCDKDVVLTVKEADTACCYVNGQYHRFSRLSQRPDAMGTITIVQEARDLNPACFQVETESETLFVNPADYARRQVLSLTDAEKARGEKIISLDGETTTGLFDGVDDEHLAVAVSGITAIQASVEELRPGYVKEPASSPFSQGMAVRINGNRASVVPYDGEKQPSGTVFSKVVENIEYAFNWLKSKIKWLYDHTIGKAVDFVVTKIKDVWKFIVRVGEKILEVVVKTVKCAFGALKKILEFIGIPLDKIFSWLRKALHIEETVRVNTAMKKMLSASSHALAVESSRLKELAGGELDKMIGMVSEWAKLDLSQGSKSAGHIVNTSLSKLAFGGGPHETYMFNMILGNLSFEDNFLPDFVVSDKMHSAVDAFSAAVKEVEADIDEMTGTVLSIGDHLQAILSAGDIFEVCEQLRKILGTVAVAGLELCRTLVDCLFDVISVILEALAEFVLKPIHIPFLSQILELFGVEEFALADIFTFPLAFFMVNGMCLAGDSGLVDAMYETMSGWTMPEVQFS